jgi:hypothetical protein
VNARGGPVVLALLLAGCGFLRDWNRDGVVLVGCLGDSNTAQITGPKWCAFLRDELPTVRTRVSAAGGSGAIDLDGTALGFPIAGSVYVDHLLAWPRLPDVAIEAWGTNDVLRGSRAAPIVRALAKHARRLHRAGIGVLVATIPYVLGEPATNAMIDRVNAAIVKRFAPCVVDFTTAPPATAEFYVNARHLNDLGQHVRARVAAGALRRAGRACGP